MNKFKKYTLGLLALAAMGTVQSCKEEIDTSARYVFKEKTIVGYLESHPQYSEYLTLMEKVPVSRRSESNVRQLLAARGNYTCFAPTNDAIQEYLDSLVSQGLISEPSWDAFTDDNKLDSIRKAIVYNSIIDGGDDVPAYETGEFEDGKETKLPNMYDRKLEIHIPTGDSLLVESALMDPINQNIPALNGVIHAMRNVVNPNNNTAGHIFATMIEEQREGALVMAKLVLACGLEKMLSQVRDEAYEELYQTGGVAEKIESKLGESGTFHTPEHRYVGYTIFAETDEFWSNAIGKPYNEIGINDVRKYLVDNNIYPDAKDNDDYESEDNLINQFVTYHILPERLPAGKLVYHYNERQYTPTAKNLTVPMCEWYTTLGKRRLLKIYESKESQGVCLNRFPKLRNGRHEDYHEASCEPENEGCRVGDPDPDNKVQNAVIYPIDRLLVYDDHTREQMQKGRIRWDVTAMWPEFMNNDIRISETTDEKHKNVYIPSDNTYKYLEDVWISSDTWFFYWTGRGNGWQNYLGDEMTIRGVQDVTFRLPPVPRKGTYELRYAIQCGGVYRTMAQVYFGDDRDNLAAQGIPMDLRQGANYRYTKNGNYVSDTGWEQDVTDDDDYNAEVDKKMRNKDFMKGCQLMTAGSPGGGTMMRASDICLRRILVRRTLDPDKTYYVRFKTVLDDPATYLYMDYLEWCPKEVYDNPAEPEDIW